MDQTPPDTIDLRDYLQVLARQWRVVAGITVVVVAAALVASFLQTPTYESSAELAIEPVRSGSDAALEDLLLRDEIVETERRVITSRNVTDRVIADLELDVSSRQLLQMVTVRTVANTRVVTITATDTDPEFAAAVANAFATSYLEYRRDRALDEVTAARANLDQRAQDLQEQVDAIDAELGEGGADPLLGSIEPDDEALAAQREALAQQLAQVRIQLASLDPGNQAIRGGGEILVPAEPGNSPVAPKPLRTGVLALVLGMMLGVGAAFLRDHFDDAIRSEDDVVRAAGGHTIIGRLTAWADDEASDRLITLVDPFAAASEEFAAMAANVRFSLIGRAGSQPPQPEGSDSEYAQRSIAVTSSSQAEGKTTVAGNLAVAAAASGRRVVLVGSDLRKPTMASRFGLPDGAGLTDLLVDAGRLAGRDSVAEHLVDVGIPRLRLLPAGSIPPNPTELLASGQMAWLHGALTSMADLVIYDTPPVLPVADTLEISQHVDLTFVVVRVETTHRRELEHAIDRLERVGTEVGGMVVNGLPNARGLRYGYGYGYGYGYRPDEYRPRTDEAADPEPAAGRPVGARQLSSVTVREDDPGPTPADTDETPPAPEPDVEDVLDEAEDPEAAAAEGADLDTWLFKNR